MSHQGVKRNHVPTNSHSIHTFTSKRALGQKNVHDLL